MPVKEAEKLLAFGVLSHEDLKIAKCISEERRERLVNWIDADNFDAIVDAAVLLNDVSCLKDREFFWMGNCF